MRIILQKLDTCGRFRTVHFAGPFFQQDHESRASLSACLLPIRRILPHTNSFTRQRQCIRRVSSIAGRQSSMSKPSLRKMIVNTVKALSPLAHELDLAPVIPGASSGRCAIFGPNLESVNGLRNWFWTRGESLAIMVVETQEEFCGCDYLLSWSPRLCKAIP